MSNGVILERLSGKKLSVLVSILFLLQIASFLFGGIWFPNATHTETVEGILCKENNKIGDKDKICYVRDATGHPNGNCKRIDHENFEYNQYSKNEFVHVFQIPLPRDGKPMQLHRSFQTMTSVLNLHINLGNKKDLKLNEQDFKISHKIPIEVKLAYRNDEMPDNEWNVMADAEIEKTFTCHLNDNYMDSIECDLVQLFELGTVHHQYYLINLKLKEQFKFTDSILSASNVLSTEQPQTIATLTFIYQTGGFTIMWLSMKTFFFPLLLFIMIWYWQRIVQLERNSNLIERMLFAVGISATLLNLPVEWLTFYFDLKWMLLYSDIRQGLFYMTLFTFWIIFFGEHLIDDNIETTACKSFKSYWRYIGAVWFGSLCLLTFELCERGMQLSDPFYSIWDTPQGTNLANATLILACLAGTFYFLLVIYLVVRIFWNFKSKQSQLPHMSKMRRLFYEGIIYRFKFLLLSTLVCVALTVTFFIFNNFEQSQWKFDEENGPRINYTSAFFTGVYGMWNIYAGALMIFYAPSHKSKPSDRIYYESNPNSESLEFVNLTSKFNTNTNRVESVLASFATKVAAS